MIRLAVDEDFDLRAIRALRRRLPEADIALVWDFVPRVPDARVLEWAAGETRVLLTRDRKTLVAQAYARVAAGQAMAGVIAMRSGASMKQVVDELELVVTCGEPEDFAGRVEFLPFGK